MVVGTVTDATGAIVLRESNDLVAAKRRSFRISDRSHKKQGALNVRRHCQTITQLEQVDASDACYKRTRPSNL